MRVGLSMKSSGLEVDCPVCGGDLPMVSFGFKMLRFRFGIECLGLKAFVELTSDLLPEEGLLMLLFL